MILGATEARTEIRTEWLHAPELWVTCLVILPAIILLVYGVYRGERGALTPLRRGILSTLRVLCILAIVLFLFEPILTKERVQRENSYILVLIDDSYSMGIKDRYSDPALKSQLSEVLKTPFDDDTTRLDLVTGLLRNSDVEFLQRLIRKGNVRVVACSDGIRALADFPRQEEGTIDLSGLDLAALELRGKVTRIGDSIYEAVNDLRGETISSVVLFSDGRDNGGVLRPEEAAFRLKRKGIPIHVVGIGNAEEPKDIRLFGLEIAEVVLERDLVPVDFSVIGEGFGGRDVKVFLKERERQAPSSSWRTLASETVILRGQGETQSVRMEFRPKRAGEYVYRVEVELQEGELFAENNFDEKAVTVLSQKIRVLYVDGPPRWEYRFMTWAVTRDPTMESQVLLTSSDPNFIQESSGGVRPVRSFPLTKEELFEYHVVMIGDVREETFTNEQKEWLVEFVEEIGGGVVFISGPAYMPQKYRGDLLERLFPVELEDSGPDILDDGYFAEEFHVRLTPEGREHPVMQLVGNPDENTQLWHRGRVGTSLPGFFWYAKTKGLKRGGVALAVHEEDQNLKLEPRPILAYQQLGRGRTFISLVDSTWRWRRMVGNKWFYRFWGQVIRFTSIGRLLGKTPRFTVSADSREYTLGQSIRVQARVLDREFKPTRDEQVTLFAEREGGRGDSRSEITATQIPARPEYYEATIEAKELGNHRVWIEDREEEVASFSYRVLVPQLESAEPQMDRPRLQQLAQDSGGIYHEVYEAGRVPDEVVPITKEIPIHAESSSLWDTPWFLLLFVAIITTEWILRKIFRLL